MTLRFDAVVVSDLHLGARNARTDEFLAFLDALYCERLIINGDLFDDERLRGLQPRDIRVIDALRHFSRTTQVEWLRGNHDPPEEWFSGLLGLEPQDEALVAAEGGDYLVCHGHVWDRSMSLPRLVIGTADAIYGGFQLIDPSHRLARSLKRKCKFFCRSVDQLRRRAVDAARERDLAGVVLGHVHVACDERIDGKHYLNCGCWTERPCGYVGLRDGEMRQHSWTGAAVAVPATTVPTAAWHDWWEPAALAAME